AVLTPLHLRDFVDLSAARSVNLYGGALGFGDQPAPRSFLHTQPNGVRCAFRPVRSADRANDRDQGLVLTARNAGITRHDAKMQAGGGRTPITFFTLRTRRPRRPRITFVAFRSGSSRLTGVAFLAPGALRTLRPLWSTTANKRDSETEQNRHDPARHGVRPLISFKKV